LKQEVYKTIFLNAKIISYQFNLFNYFLYEYLENNLSKLSEYYFIIIR